MGLSADRPRVGDGQRVPSKGERMRKAQGSRLGLRVESDDRILHIGAQKPCRCDGEATGVERNRVGRLLDVDVNLLGSREMCPRNVSFQVNPVSNRQYALVQLRDRRGKTEG